MVFFCPHCANVLLTETGPNEQLRFYCRTCPYVFNISSTVTHKAKLKRKELDAVMGVDAFDGVNEVDGKLLLDIHPPFLLILFVAATCEKCSNTRAFFMQMQTRSADEPMTLFFKCTKCGNQWKEG